MAITSKFKCLRGHEYVSDGGEPSRFAFKFQNGQIATSAICPYCFIEWISTAFPIQEVSRETTEDIKLVDPNAPKN